MLRQRSAGDNLLNIYEKLYIPSRFRMLSDYSQAHFNYFQL